jgi:hypothetical protein
MQALRRRGSIAPTHSWPLDGVSGQRHAPAALYPRAKDPQYPLDRRLGGPQSWSGHKGWSLIVCIYFIYLAYNVFNNAQTITSNDRISDEQ